MIEIYFQSNSYVSAENRWFCFTILLVVANIVYLSDSRLHLVINIYVMYPIVIERNLRSIVEFQHRKIQRSVFFFLKYKQF